MMASMSLMAQTKGGGISQSALLQMEKSQQSGIANKAFGSIGMALGYYGARFDTVYPTTYLGTNGQSGGIVSLAAGATNPAAPGGGLAI